VLASDRYASEVRDDERTARELGVSGVPFFVIGKKYAVSGAQPVEVMKKALERAWADPEVQAAQGAHRHGASCGPDGCA
jgi:predicted DsbA family dithiol-disulfide isomerase